jgi:uncharacterized protein
MRGLARFLLAAAMLATAAALAAPSLPQLTGRVVDLAGVLSPAAEQALSERLAEHERRTSNQVVVATVPSLQGYDIERYAVELFRAWSLGRQDRNNGVLLLVAPNERAVRIEVGYGLEGTLTDALASEIIRNRILPRLRMGDLAGGIASGVDGILAVTDGTYKPVAEQPPPAQAVAPLLIMLAWIAFVFIITHLRANRSRYSPAIWYGPGWVIGPRGGGMGGGFGGGFDRGGGGFSGGGGSSGGGGASGHW